MILKPLVAALLIAACTAAITLPADAREKKAEAAKGPKLTPAVQNALAAAQTALKAGDTATATAKLNEAAAVPDHTSTDNYYVAQIRISVGQATKDNVMLKAGLEQSLASGQATAEQTQTFEQVLGDLALNAKDYPTATHYYQLVQQKKPNDPGLAAQIAKLTVENRSVPPQDRIAALQSATTIAEKAGQKPEEYLYGAQLQIAYDNKLAAQIDPAAQALLKAYPSAKNWENSIEIFRSGKNLDAQVDLDTYRLQRAAGALTGQGEYLDYANVAQQRGLPAEAKAVLDEGAAKRVIDVSKPNYIELKRIVSPAKVAADRATLPGLERQARAAATGKLARATADGYLSNGEYAKAADLYRVALAKGGENTDLLNTRLGYALAMSGDKAGATAAFGAVSGQPRAVLAQYWTIWVSQKA